MIQWIFLSIQYKSGYTILGVSGCFYGYVSFSLSIFPENLYFSERWIEA